MALSTILTVDGQFAAQALKYMLPEIHPSWRIGARWPSPQDQWMELRPFVVGADGRLIESVEKALENVSAEQELGSAVMAIRAIRIGALKWASQQLKL